MPSPIAIRRKDAPFTPPADFWSDFVERFWERGATTLRYQAEQPLMTEAEALAIFLGLAERFRAGGEADIDLYVENGLLKSDIGRLLPAAADRDIAAYQARVTDQLGGRRFSLVTNSVRRESREHLKRVKAFTRGLIKLIGQDAGWLGADIFLSNTLKTAFGVHRDSASNFSYIVSGRKRMLVWPCEVFACRRDLRCAGPKKNVFLDDVNCEPYRDQAIVLEGGAGDMLYWPASYWHVAESTGKPSLVFNVPIYLNSAVNRMAAEYYLRKLSVVSSQLASPRTDH
ncbi:MAG TPA: cupin-like domain-containing protein [Pirellulaceae bacterium]|nr:cupin-like domain-containing protein [Pirellulaceae bacterium]